MAFEGPSGLHNKLAQGLHPLGHLVDCKDKTTISSDIQGQALRPTQDSQESLCLPKGLFPLILRVCKAFF